MCGCLWSNIHTSETSEFKMRETSEPDQFD